MPDLRSFYRVIFPIGARPWLRVGDGLYPVLDCSERGLRIQAESARRPEVNAPVHGKIRFPTGDECEVEGVVLRHTADGAALSLDGRGIELGVILRLQLHLRRRFWLADEDP